MAPSSQELEPPEIPGRFTTVITTQLPLEHWHAWIADATVADAILDRLMQRIQRINLAGESMRRPAARTPPKQAL